MQIETRRSVGLLVVKVRESRIDAAGALTFKEKIRSVIQGFDGRVVIDMEAVGFLDSSGLGALVGILKMLDKGRRLELARCGAVVLRVLTLTRMEGVFVLHDAVPEVTPGALDLDETAA